MQTTQSNAVSIIDTLGNIIRDIFLYNNGTTIRFSHWSYLNNLIAIEWQNTSTIVPTIWTINSGTLEVKNLINEGSITPRWSFDGTKIAYIKYDSRIFNKNNGTVWIANSDGTNKRQLTPGLK